MQATGNGSGGHHSRKIGYSGAMTVRVRGDRRGRLHQCAPLNSEVWGRESEAKEYCQGVWRLYGLWSHTLGGLQGTDVGAPRRPRQLSWSTASRHGEYLATDSGEVCASGDGGRMPSRPAGRNSSAVAWRRGLGEVSMRYGFCVIIAPRRRTRGSSSLTHIMCSMRRNSNPCCGQCGLSGSVVHGSQSTATTTGPH